RSKEAEPVSEKHLDDADWAPAAEQSSEDDEAQTGNVLAGNEKASDAAEHKAMHVDGEGGESDGADSEQVSIADPEADAIVNDALEIDETSEAEAAADVLSDDSTENGEATPTEAEIDPYAEFKAELRTLEGKWYVIHSYAGFERKVKANIEQRKSTLEVEEDIYQVEVPMEDVVEIKNGQRKMVTRVRVPGYVLVRMELNEDTWSVVRHTPGVTGFVGNAHNPAPLRFDEAFNMLKPLAELKEAEKAAAGDSKAKETNAQRSIPAEIDFEIGETITIKDGSFAGLPGS